MMLVAKIDPIFNKTPTLIPPSPQPETPQLKTIKKARPCTERSGRVWVVSAKKTQLNLIDLGVMWLIPIGVVSMAVLLLKKTTIHLFRAWIQEKISNNLRRFCRLIRKIWRNRSSYLVAQQDCLHRKLRVRNSTRWSMARPKQRNFRAPLVLLESKMIMSTLETFPGQCCISVLRLQLKNMRVFM